MGASDLTTEVPETGNGEVAHGDHVATSNGHVAKKRKRQKALASVVANGHVSKVAQRGNGAVVAGEPPAEVPVADEPVDAVPEGTTVELPAVEEVDDADLEEADLEIPPAEAAIVEELDDADSGSRRTRKRAKHRPAADEDALDELPSDGGRKGRRRAAKSAKVAAKQAAPRGRAAKRAAAAGHEVPLRGRAAKRAIAARRSTPAGRRAELVATAAQIAAAAAAAAEPAKPGRKRATKYMRRLVALIAVAMIPASVYALVTTDGPASSLSRADARYMSAQLMTADQRVRRQLVRLKPRQTSAAVGRTRDAKLTAISLSLELENAGGGDAELLRRALKLESAWLDAVGSVLLNPRSALRDRLVALDAAVRPALNALPVPEGRRKGGAEALVRYAKSRVAAKRKA